MGEKTFGVPNMNCGGCQSSIEEALEGLAGLESIQVALDDKKITVRYASDEVWTAVRAAIEGAGFTVQERP